MENVFLKKNNKKEFKIEKNEEKLHKVYKPNVTNSDALYMIGVDSGSTQNRVIIVSADRIDPYDVYVIPSAYSLVDDDLEILPKDNRLYCNMDSTMQNITNKVGTVFAKQRVIRGEKKFDHGGVDIRIDSSTQKIANIAFYTNIIDSIGYGILQRQGDDIPANIDIYLGVALPPDDLASNHNITKFRNNILGDYKWTHNQTGVTIKFSILDVVLSTEPEALYDGYCQLTGEDIPEYALHLEGGGRSFGSETLKRGERIAAYSRSLNYGGTQLALNLATNFVSKKGGRASDASIRDALLTGFYKQGNSSIDITDIVKQTKKNFAQQLFTDCVKEVIDQFKDITIETINVISVSGRLFDEGEYGYSIAEPLMELFSKLSPGTEFMHIKENYIPQGLALKLLATYGEYILGNDEDEDEDEEEGNEENNNAEVMDRVTGTENLSVIK